MKTIKTVSSLLFFITLVFFASALFGSIVGWFCGALSLIAFYNTIPRRINNLGFYY